LYLRFKVENHKRNKIGFVYTNGQSVKGTTPKKGETKKKGVTATPRRRNKRAKTRTIRSAEKDTKPLS